MKKKNERNPRPRIVYATAATLAVVVGASALAHDALGANAAPKDAIVVYPASATSKIPETIAAIPSATRPVPETDDYDPETPLGQVRSVLDTLRRLRNGQQDCAQTLDEVADRLENALNARADELRASLDANTERVARLEDALGASSRRTRGLVAPEPSSGSDRSRESQSSQESRPRSPITFWRAFMLLVLVLVVWDRARRQERVGNAVDRSTR